MRFAKTTTIMAVQLPIPFAFHDNQDFDAYYSGPNTQAVAALKDCAGGQGEHLIFLWGDHGSGKSHLLQASCQYARQGIFYLPLRDYWRQGPSLLEGLEQCPMVCVDDIHCIAGKNDWELEFFNFFNRQRDKGRRLVVSARFGPNKSNIQLADLTTRLAWGLTLQLHPLTDQDKQLALTLRAEQKGLALPANVAQFLLNHYPRDLPSLWILLEELDHETLSAQRKLTIPFVKSFMHKRRIGNAD